MKLLYINEENPTYFLRLVFINDVIVFTEDC